MARHKATKKRAHILGSVLAEALPAWRQLYRTGQLPRDLYPKPPRDPLEEASELLASIEAKQHKPKAQKVREGASA